MGIERRKCWRVKCNLPVKYSVVNLNWGGDYSVRESTILNISMGGTRFVINHHVATFDLFKLEISLPESPQIKVLGEVKWAVRLKNKTYNLGIQFLRIADEDRERIKDYILAKSTPEKT